MNMSERDQFAMAALAMFPVDLSKDEISDAKTLVKLVTYRARLAYAMADAMIEARKTQ